MNKIACDLCGGTIAHVIGNSMIEIVRQDHKVTSIGKDYSLIVSCPNTGKCNNKITLTIENGKILLENLKRKEQDDNSSTKEGGGTSEEDTTTGGSKAGDYENQTKTDGNTSKGEGSEDKENGGEGEEDGNTKTTGGDTSQSDKRTSNERKYTRV